MSAGFAKSLPSFCVILTCAYTFSDDRSVKSSDGGILNSYDFVRSSVELGLISTSYDYSIAVCVAGTEKRSNSLFVAGIEL